MYPYQHTLILSTSRQVIVEVVAVVTEDEVVVDLDDVSFIRSIPNSNKFMIAKIEVDSNSIKFMISKIEVDSNTNKFVIAKIKVDSISNKFMISKIEVNSI